MGALFSKRIFIANGYDENIFGRVDTDKSTATKCGATHLKLPSAIIGGDSDKNHQTQGEEENEFTTNELFKEKLFTKIGPGFRACFRTAKNANSKFDAAGGESSSSSSQVYISIALANGDFICRGLQVSSGCVINVDSQGNLKMSQQHSMAAKKSSSVVPWKDFVVDVRDDNTTKKNI